MVFHVYVDGVTGTAPDAMRALAEAMAARYGVPASELRARLARGSFRVKANVDQATANSYALDLASIGAQVRIEPAAPSGSARPRAPAPSGSVSNGPRPHEAAAADSPSLTARAAKSSLPPQPVARPSQSSLPRSSGPRSTKSSLPPRPARPSTNALAAGPVVSRRPTHAELSPAAARPSEGAPVAWPSGSDGWASREADATGAAGSLDSLGALDTYDGSAMLSLATLDNEPRASSSGSASPMALPASIGPASPQGAARAERPREEPVDLFAPPDELAGEVAVELAVDELAYRARKRGPEAGRGDDPPARRAAAATPMAYELATSRTSTRPGPQMARPPAGAGSTASRTERAAHGQPGASSGQRESIDSPGRGDQASLDRGDQASSGRGEPSPSGRSDHASSSRGDQASSGSGEPGAGATSMGTGAASWLANPMHRLAAPRTRLAVGVVLAIVLGFLPADIISTMRERAMQHEIDGKVLAAQAAADTPDRYAALEAFRAEQLAAKRSQHRTIALTALLIWAAAGGAVGYAWFRVIRWDRYT